VGSLTRCSTTSARGDEWKDIRSHLSPIFTSGKMKGMFKFIVEVSQKLVNELEKKTDMDEFDIKELSGKFSMDALATCAFGLDFNSFADTNTPFVKYASELFKQDIYSLLAMFKLMPGVPRLFQIFNINVQRPKTTKFFRDIVIRTLKARSESGQRRNDMIDMMLDVMKGQERDKEQNEHEKDQYEQDMSFAHNTRRGMTEKDIISNLILLLIVGYDTTGMTLAFIMYELAENEDVQEKLRQEVDDAWEGMKGDFPDYSTVQGLPYLEAVIMESLRMHAPADMTVRSAAEDYKLPGTDYVVNKNEMVTFVTRVYHKDPEHWSHPDTFYPDHWTPEEKNKR
jgi:cytochrome P450